MTQPTLDSFMKPAHDRSEKKPKETTHVESLCLLSSCATPPKKKPLGLRQYPFALIPRPQHELHDDTEEKKREAVEREDDEMADFLGLTPKERLRDKWRKVVTPGAMVYGECLDAMMEFVLGLSVGECNITLLSCACLELNATVRNSDRTVVWPFYHRKHYVLVVLEPGKDFLRVYDSILNYYSSDRDSDLVQRTGRKHVLLGVSEVQAAESNDCAFYTAHNFARKILRIDGGPSLMRPSITRFMIDKLEKEIRRETDERCEKRARTEREQQ